LIKTTFSNQKKKNSIQLLKLHEKIFLSTTTTIYQQHKTFDQKKEKEQHNFFEIIINFYENFHHGVHI